MRSTLCAILTFCMLCNSCDSVKTDIALDELNDKAEYTGGMVIDSSNFGETETECIIVNNTEYPEPEYLDLNMAGYYRIEIYTRNTGNVAPEVIRLVILDPERGDAEWGLPKWTPEGVTTGAVGEQEIKLVYPPVIPAGASFPLIVMAGGYLTESTDNLSARVGSAAFYIKRGVGSVWIPAGDQAANQLNIDHRSFPVETNNFDDPPLPLGGVIDADMQIPAGSYMNIAEDLTIPEGITLTIENGVFITIDPEVNIYNNGSILFRGMEESPVTITCTDDNLFWGGVIGKRAGNRVEASHTIFCRSGHHTGGDYDYGHAHRQALFYCENGELLFDHCYMTDHAGQVFYPVSASLEIKFCLLQRAITGGQANASQVVIDHSVFTDFPDDQPGYLDQDNDGLYLMECDAVISNSIFMYAKDDGLDSGGSGGGEVTVSNTRFESIFHEGAALSSGGNVTKHHYFTNCIFTGCGQGLELGYSSPGHQVSVDSCRFVNNGIGIRYGDNYAKSHQGIISVSNSESIENITHDIWNMVREEWMADTFKMEFNNVWVSTKNPMYPQLKIHE